ncbi:MAG: ATP:cob(I)alamin adenosyltransferase [Candidatus Marinimicrobia bacterium]|nr:ATP:cob(I)alamin adenosyltransferase [Candidatus Neomarinimicrobiota bacterium]|tara:strand:+ start:1637 stop:2176 length:540 start_codon:yes stop_codon:yes gene_type:complete
MRITKVYTRKGDDGTTSLGKGERVMKNSFRIIAFGSLDELNSVIGVVLSEKINEKIISTLNITQQLLFHIGGELSVPSEKLNLLKSKDVNQLEEAIDDLNKDLPPLEDFVLPCGSKASAFLHQARAVCRRSERDLVNLDQEEGINPLYIQYINRLSDFLFVAARYSNFCDDIKENLWEK